MVIKAPNKLTVNSTLWIVHSPNKALLKTFNFALPESINPIQEITWHVRLAHRSSRMEESANVIELLSKQVNPFLLSEVVKSAEARSKVLGSIIPDLNEVVSWLRWVLVLRRRQVSWVLLFSVVFCGIVCSLGFLGFVCCIRLLFLSAPDAIFLGFWFSIEFCDLLTFRSFAMNLSFLRCLSRRCDSSRFLGFLPNFYLFLHHFLFSHPSASLPETRPSVSFLTQIRSSF